MARATTPRATDGAASAPRPVPRSDTELVAELRVRGHRATSQRLVLHRVLRELDRHATADELQRAAAPRLPQLSLPTVYATLELFEDLGLVRRIPAATGVTLYDPRPDDHAHLVCRSCGGVEDLSVRLDPSTALAAARRAGFAPERAETSVVGLCGACRG